MAEKGAKSRPKPARAAAEASPSRRRSAEARPARRSRRRPATRAGVSAGAAVQHADRRPARGAGDAVAQSRPRGADRPGRDRRGGAAAGRPARGAQSRPLPRRAGPDRGDRPAGRPARAADARPGRPVQPLHGPLAVGRQRLRRRDAGRRSSSPAKGDKRFADPDWTRQSGVRRDEAVLSAHLQLAERPGRRRRGRRSAWPSGGSSSSPRC